MKCRFRLCTIVAFFVVVRLTTPLHSGQQQIFITGDPPDLIRFAPVSLKIHLWKEAAISKTSHLRYGWSLLLTWIILLSGDAKANPEPRTVKFPCKIYTKPVKRNQRGVQCDVYDEWLHTRCDGISNIQYSELQQSDDSWYCTRCLGEAMPFMTCLTTIYRSMKQLTPLSTHHRFLTPPTSNTMTPQRTTCLQV